MRLATILENGAARAAVVRGEQVLPIAVGDDALESVRSIAAEGAAALEQIRAWANDQASADWRRVAEVALGPAVPDPRAIYTIGLNYRSDGEPDDAGPARPLVYGKATSSVTGHGSTVTWDRALTANVDAECELGVVIGEAAFAVAPADAMRHVFGYTVINDISSRDPWLDGDQWLVGKSMPGFCPVGPWVVTADALDPARLRLGCTVDGTPIQDGTTADMRFGIPDVISYLSRHCALRPGDLIATGTPVRLAGPLGPDRHLRAGDVVTVWIEGIGELTTRIA